MEIGNYGIPDIRIPFGYRIRITLTNGEQVIGRYTGLEVHDVGDWCIGFDSSVSRSHGWIDINRVKSVEIIPNVKKWVDLE